ncbi:MAG: DUF3737 family protein [Oscillospiraceae bacterium]|nr:DUF3737 family protein [Oscillospiraceae bacterium]
MTYHEVHQRIFNTERALYNAENLLIFDTIFETGESPLKHSQNMEIYGCIFRSKYPVWYSKNCRLQDCIIEEDARAGFWYTNDIEITDSLFSAPKAFRKCDSVFLKNVSLPHAEETLWENNGVQLRQVTASGDYFAKNCRNVEINYLTLKGNYSFDSIRNAEIRNAKILGRDAFWNCENVTVYDSYISGKYIGWNSKNITFINCTIESEQGFCYMENLVMQNCKLINTTLAFEYSTVDLDIVSDIESVKNPSGGMIRADKINTLILEQHRIEPSATKIICRKPEI